MVELNEKTLFDGRLHFHKRLDLLWTGYHNCSLHNEFNGCLIALNGILTETSNLVDTKLETEFLEEIDKINQLVQTKNSGQKVNPNAVNDFIIHKKLRDLAMKIRRHTKRLYIPIEEFETTPEELFKKIERESG